MATIDVNTFQDTNDGAVTPTSATIALRDSVVSSETNPGTTIKGATGGGAVLDGAGTYRGSFVSGFTATGPDAGITAEASGNLSL